MTRFNRLPQPLKRAFEHRKALKIISGLQNFDPQLVSNVAQAATLGGASFIDIAADANLIALAKQHGDLPVCVSAIEPEKLAAAIAAGADLVEIGNYDSFYQSGRIFSAATVIDLTNQTLALLPDTALSVTVPHTLPLDQQVALAEQLAALGVDIIQTEGGTSSAPVHGGTLGLIEKAAPTLAAASEISRAVNIPVLCASGISNVTAPMAIAAGAAGVGVGSAINQLQDPIAMVAAVRSLSESIDRAVVLR
ncbi:protein of unknown function DUF561 [Thalassoporum mexicanum PCC 7367]|uniref:DUF561 domain-containing protein n=1 Tax=Thalassoporum mexicanum TaxID=3457544 RepID=UPI00029FD590|nr:DUF561 domain-containing protein [Pseudanabaena sp. PCC 7367]AFY68644.1 protein of unknown function DUF561 [Pseudanabaena sp. PCC 7367]